MACDLTVLLKQPQIWNSLDDNTILCIQIALMCDALDGIDTSTFDLKEMVARVSCINKLAPNTIMGMWTTLFGQILASGTAIGNQVMYYSGTDPNSDGIVPINPNAAAIAVKPGSSSYVWDNVNLTWT